MKKHQWADFRLTDFFHLEKGNQNNMAALNDGNIPLVSARKCNNGYKQFVSPNNKKLFDGNILTLNNDGDGGAGIAFYQPYRMALDSHVTALIPRIELNRFHLLFMAMCITKQRGSFGHGHSLNSSRLYSFKYMLPVTADKQPDWRFMENYMQNKEQKLLENYKSYLKRVMPSHKPLKAVLEGKKWKAFFLTDVFNLDATKSSIDKCKLNGTIGDVPYITRTDTNNGWDSLIGSQSNYEVDDANVITIGLDTQSVFYQPIPFYTGQNIQVLSSVKLNKHVASFIIPLLKIQMKKFNWGGNGATLGRLKRLKIMLPVDENEEPDYAFMSAYMKRLEYDIQRRYLENYE